MDSIEEHDIVKSFDEIMDSEENAKKIVSGWEDQLKSNQDYIDGTIQIRRVGSRVSLIQSKYSRTDVSFFVYPTTLLLTHLG